MTVKIKPPTTYRHWTGRPASRRGAGDWPYPAMREIDDVWFTEVIKSNDWFNAGYCPRGANRRQRWSRHWHHGRLMRYPRLSVLAFCLRDLMSQRHGTLSQRRKPMRRKG